MKTKEAKQRIDYRRLATNKRISRLYNLSKKIGREFTAILRDIKELDKEAQEQAA